ncbi:MAG TPA: hypothetical protein VD967_03485, partial [Candidatus Paceibacterota bacterium]|nr:hypothetical protein [Candidatus Paceibacterota bacterium]
MAIKLSATRLDLGTARLDNANLRAYSEVTNALGNVSGATTINLALGCIVTATATAAVTWTITNTPSSSAYCAFTLILTNGGRYTQVWPSGTKWQNSVSPTLSVIGTDVLTFFTVDGGTTWQGSVVMQNSTSTGRLFAWGYGALGRLGLGDAANRSSPVQVSGSWAAVTVNSTTSSHSAVIKSDGSLWVWGRNSYGQLGQSDVVHRSSPVQVAGTWIQVVTGQNHTAAIKTDNTLWTWGYNHRGQLGIGSTQ